MFARLSASSAPAINRSEISGLNRLATIANRIVSLTAVPYACVSRFRAHASRRACIRSRPLFIPKVGDSLLEKGACAFLHVFGGAKQTKQGSFQELPFVLRHFQSAIHRFDAKFY